MEHIRVIFFGSTDDSVLVLNRLLQSQLSTVTLSICCVITQPPRPVGRKQVITPTPVELWAKAHNIPVLSFASHPEKSWAYADEDQVIDSLEPFKTNLVVSACYGQKIPSKTIRDARYGGLNVHPSLLPRWRGADPVPWAILVGDHQTGVTIVTLLEKFDEGNMIIQKKLPIADTDTSDALRTKLFTMGADLLMEVLPSCLTVNTPVIRHPPSPVNVSSYARRFTRDDGFLPWELMKAAMEGASFSTIQQYDNPPGGEASATIIKDYLRQQHEWDAKQTLGAIVERFFRALSPWPGIWTLVQVKSQKSKVKSEEKRLKILSLHLQPTTYNLQFDTVQLEGKKPVSWEQFISAYPQ